MTFTPTELVASGLVALIGAAGSAYAILEGKALNASSRSYFKAMESMKGSAPQETRPPASMDSNLSVNLAAEATGLSAAGVATKYATVHPGPIVTQKPSHGFGTEFGPPGTGHFYGLLPQEKIEYGQFSGGLDYGSEKPVKMDPGKIVLSRPRRRGISAELLREGLRPLGPKKGV